ncbi:MAG: hypothetical protein SH848_12925 [Saprospiraceae bacterium]|nr:hypothetical protein [Saprospiraceae bacterium]
MMKKLLPFFVTLPVLFLGVFACNNSANETALTKTESSTAAGSGKLPAFQISADSAQTWMVRWATQRNEMVEVLQNSDIAQDTAFLVYGFQIPRLELDSMLNYLGPDPKVWAMLAIKYNATTQTFVPELVFAGEPNSGGSWSYYDFTAPCPNACPEDNLDR